MRNVCYDTSMKLEEILGFIKTNNLMAISTTHDDGTPEAAIVEFAERDDLAIIFDTLNTSRKYQNLQRDPHVALVIGWDDSITVQLEGEAKELEGPELEDAKQLYFTKNPAARKWGDNPDIAYFEVTPTWVRYTDLNQHPWFVQELSLGK